MPLPLIAAIGLGVSAAGSIGQMISGASRANKAKKALENYQRQELKNVTEGLRVSTLGAEMQTQEAQRRFATTVEALQAGGVRGLVGGLGAAEKQQQQVQQQIGANLDQQQAQIDRMRAQDEANIRSMQESREQQEIAGLGQEQAAGRQLLNSGISGLMQTGQAAFTMGLGSNPVGKTAGTANMSQAFNAANTAGSQALLSLSQPSFSQNANPSYSGNLGSLGRVNAPNPFRNPMQTPSVGSFDFSGNPFTN